jgi:hypothetical protein
MMDKKIQPLLRDPNIRPTPEVLSEILEDAYIAYTVFMDATKKHDIDVQWRYYSDGKQWLAKGICRWTGSRGVNNEKTVFWLSIWERMFKVTMYIPQKYHDELLTLPCDEDTMMSLKNLRPMGKRLNYLPLIFDIKSQKKFDSLFMIFEKIKRVTQ